MNTGRKDTKRLALVQTTRPNTAAATTTTTTATTTSTATATATATTATAAGIDNKLCLCKVSTNFRSAFILAWARL